MFGAIMRVMGYSSHMNPIGMYRLYSPLYWMNKLGLHETVPLMPVEGLHVPLDPPTEASPDPRYQVKVGSIREHYAWADLIVRQKCNNSFIMAMLQLVQERYNLPLIVDSDDDMIHTHDDNPASYAYRNSTDPADAAEDVRDIKQSEIEEYEKKGYKIAKFGDIYRAGRFKAEWITYYTLRMMKMADAITVTNNNLRQVYLPYNPNVYVLPNYIDPIRWEGITKAKSDKVVVGWFGGISHLSDLQVIREVIPDILAKYPDVIVKICGMFPKFWITDKEKYGERLQIVKWQQDVTKWEAHFASMGIDVMLAPLIDTQFNRCKSNIKWMESAMLKIPVIASPVEPYLCIQDKKDGFLAGKYYDWMKRLGTLIASPDLRVEIGTNAYNRVIQDFNMKDHAQNWATVYQQVYDKKAALCTQR